MVADSSAPETSSPSAACPGPATITVPAMAVKCMPQIAAAITTAAAPRWRAVRRLTTSHRATLAAATAISTDSAKKPGR